MDNVFSYILQLQNYQPMLTILTVLAAFLVGLYATGKLCSDLRLGSDGMKLQPAGSHHTRLSAGPPAVPSSSQPV